MKKFLILILALVLVPMFSGCNRRTDNQIKLAEVTHSVFYAPQYVALGLGFFEEEGLEVELLLTPGADNVMAALLSGEVQIGLAGAEATIYVYAQGQENYSINFAQLTQRDGQFLVGREPVEDFDFAMLKDSEIIGGRRGGMPIMVLEYVLKLNGLDAALDNPEKEVNIRSDVQFAAMAGAFVSGQGDYVTLFEPTATMLEKEDQAYVLTSIGEHTGILPYTNYFASKDYIEKNPEIIQKFTNAIYKAQVWVYNHTAREIAEVCLPYFPDSNIDDLTMVMQRYMDIEAWAPNPVLKKSTLDHFMDIMDGAGELPARVPYNKIVTTEFAEEAMKAND